MRKVAYLIKNGAHSELLTWLKRVNAQSCLLDWKGCMLKVAYLIEKGAPDFGFRQFEHAYVKGELARGGEKIVYWHIIQTVWTLICKSERARGGGAKLCMRNRSDVLLEYMTQQINWSCSMAHTRCTYVSSMAIFLVFTFPWEGVFMNIILEFTKCPDKRRNPRSGCTLQYFMSKK